MALRLNLTAICNQSMTEEILRSSGRRVNLLHQQDLQEQTVNIFGCPKFPVTALHRDVDS